MYSKFVSTFLRSTRSSSEPVDLWLCTAHPYIDAVEALFLSDPESKSASETTYDLILKLAKEGVTAPMRYRM